ncbi:MAG: LysR family transcriptional regulator [Frankia sp.]
MSALTLTGLRVIREVAALGSITAAAESLGYTQSTISRQVAAMEAASGSPLFEREARGVRPSPAGTLLIEHAGRILADVDAASQALAGLRDRLAGRLAVGAFPTATAVLVPRALARLAAQHPALSVRLREGSTPTQLRRLRAGRIEVAVIAVGAGLPPYELSGLGHHHVFDGKLRVAVPAGHRLLMHRRVTVADLRTEMWIVGEGAQGDPQFGAWPTLAEPRIGHAVHEWPTRLGMVAAGLGITVLPELAAASVPAGVEVVAVEDPEWGGRATIALTRPDRSPSAAAMVQALQAVGVDLKATHA